MKNTPPSASVQIRAIHALPKRVKLGSNPFVKASTQSTFKEWQKLGISHGKAIDQLVAFAQLNKFTPTSP